MILIIFTIRDLINFQRKILRYQMRLSLHLALGLAMSIATTAQAADNLPSREEMWKIMKEMNMPDCLEPDMKLTYQEFYDKHKKPRKALFG